MGPLKFKGLNPPPTVVQQTDLISTTEWLKCFHFVCVLVISVSRVGRIWKRKTSYFTYFHRPITFWQHLKSESDESLFSFVYVANKKPHPQTSDEARYFLGLSRTQNFYLSYIQ